MTTINTKNEKSSETHYVTLADIGNMDPCSFPDGKNPVTNVTCKETFQNNNEAEMPDDVITQIYFASLSILGIFILYRFMDKSK